MQILQDIEMIDLCLYLKEERILVLGDIHMGYEEALNKQGYLIPRHQYKMTAERMKKNFDLIKEKGYEVDTIIINGDVKHEFGTISDTEWRHTLRVIDFLASKSSSLLLIKGNHDKILGPIADKRNIEVIECFITGEILITHGDVITKEAKLDRIKTIIIGHEHPAVSLVDYPRTETFKCFLKGKWSVGNYMDNDNCNDEKNLIVMPSYNLVTEGTDVLKERFLSPFLKQGLDDFTVFVVDKEILDFGRIKDIKAL